MSESVRTPLYDEQEQNPIADMLTAIYEHYKPLFVEDDEVLRLVDLYDCIAHELWVRAGGSRKWRWRYIQSIHSGTLEPSRFIRAAIEKLYLDLTGRPAPVYVEPCPKCHHAPTVCLCDGSKVVKAAPQGAPRKRAPRIEIALSDPERARARLEQALQELE